MSLWIRLQVCNHTYIHTYIQESSRLTTISTVSDSANMLYAQARTTNGHRRLACVGSRVAASKDAEARCVGAMLKSGSEYLRVEYGAYVFQPPSSGHAARRADLAASLATGAYMPLAAPNAKASV